MWRRTRTRRSSAATRIRPGQTGATSWGSTGCPRPSITGRGKSERGRAARGAGQGVRAGDRAPRRPDRRGRALHDRGGHPEPGRRDEAAQGRPGVPGGAGGQDTLGRDPHRDPGGPPIPGEPDAAAGDLEAPHQRHAGSERDRSAEAERRAAHPGEGQAAQEGRQGGRGSVTGPRQRGGVLLRLGFFLLLGGGLVLWSELRRPRDLRLDLDLTSALPGEIVEVDVTVSRDRHALLRFDQKYGSAGAPAMLHLTVRARPGPVEVDIMLIDSRGTARRTRATVELGKEKGAVVKPG